MSQPRSAIADRIGPRKFAPDSGATRPISTGTVGISEGKRHLAC